MKVLLLGATGLTGGLVLRELLASPEVDRVVALARRQIELKHPKLESHQVEFDSIEAKESLFQADVAISCLGTTLKKAGSRRRFREVDHDYVLRAATCASRQGVKAFLLMSAMGASSSSRLFYNRVKGELEDDIEALAFPYLSIYQPSLLLSERIESRTAERVGIAITRRINPLMAGPLRPLRGIEPQKIAKAMCHEVETIAKGNRRQPFGKERLRFDEITELASNRWRP